MTVGELKLKLAQYPDDYLVTCYDPGVGSYIATECVKEAYLTDKDNVDAGGGIIIEEVVGFPELVRYNAVRIW